MKLHEALRASRIRQANAQSGPGAISVGSRQIRSIIADDVGVAIIWILEGDEDEDIFGKRSWTDFPPDILKVIFAAEWGPIDPKSTLIRLADVLTDWVEG